VSATVLGWVLTNSAGFIVERSDEGDLGLGFHGFAWHTRGDILASLAGISMDVAVRQYIDALLAGKLILAIARVDNNIRDVWVTDDPRPDKYKPDDETIQFGYWDGRLPCRPSEERGV
jgi:hypothetical protein